MTSRPRIRQGETPEAYAKRLTPSQLKEGIYEALRNRPAESPIHETLRGLSRTPLTDCLLLGASLGIQVESLAEELHEDERLVSAGHGPMVAEDVLRRSIDDRVRAIDGIVYRAMGKCGIGTGDHPVWREWHAVSEHHKAGELRDGDAALESLAEMLSEGRLRTRVRV